jgi:hypothetical protein
MVTERQAEPQKAFKRAQNLQQQQYGVRRFFEGFSKKVSSSVEELLDRSCIHWTVHAPWMVPCRFYSDRSESQKFLNILDAWESSKCMGIFADSVGRVSERGADARKWGTRWRRSLRGQIFGDWL